MSPDYTWRPMRPADLQAVERLGNAIHLDHPEDEAVFVERLHLCPEGCHTLDGPAGLAGYIISHPWHSNSPPPLNTLLGALPVPAATWYIHDLALHPSARGTGAAPVIVAQLTAHGRIELIAVGASPRFWARQGFRPAPLPAEKLASYGTGAQFMVKEQVFFL